MTDRSQRPRVTVLMPVYNGERYLSEAVESILAQSFTDFEFLIIDDGSSDGTAALLDTYHDSRIRRVENEKNLGLIATLNRGLDLSCGEYIARMDCDDISLPRRLEKQVAFLDSNQNIGVCGTWFKKFGAVNKVLRWHTDPDAIRSGLIFTSTLGHPTVMMRRELFRKHALYYDPAYIHAEDHALWVRASRFMLFANLGEVLLLYRVHPNQVSERMSETQLNSAAKLCLQQLRALGIEPTTEEFAIHQAIATCKFAGIDTIIEKADAWLCKLKAANDHQKEYAEPAFSKVLVEQWLTMCKKANDRGIRSRHMFFAKILKVTGLGWRYVFCYLFKHLKQY